MRDGGVFWTQDETDYLSSAWRDGLSLEGIASHVGRTKKAVHDKIRRMRKQDEFVAPSMRKNPRYHPEQVKVLALQLNKQGLSYSEIAKLLRVPFGTARSMILRDKQLRAKEEQSRLETERRRELISQTRTVYLPEPPKCFVPRKPVNVHKPIAKTRRIDVTGAICGDPGFVNIRIARNERTYGTFDFEK